MEKGYIYKLTHDKDFPFIAYIGQTVNPENRKSCHLNGHSATHNWKFRKFHSKFGCNCLKFEIIWEGDKNEMGDVETSLIEDYTKQYGIDKLFNIAKGGEGIDSETARKNAIKKINDGTHPFLQEEHKNQTKLRNLKNIKNGTFPLTSELAKKTNKDLLDQGKHHFINNIYSTKRMEKRMNSGIPYIIGFNDDHSIIFWNNKDLKDNGFNYTHAISVCKGRLKQHKGYIFKYHPNYTPK